MKSLMSFVVRAKILARCIQLNNPPFINEIIIFIMSLFMISSIQCTSLSFHHDDKNSEMNHHNLMSKNFMFNDETENLIDDDRDQQRKFRGRNKYESTTSTLTSIVPTIEFSSPSYSFSSLSHHNPLNDEENFIFRHEWNFTEVNLANSHLFYIRTKYSCSTPRAKLVKVLDYHASPLKQYVPRYGFLFLKFILNLIMNFFLMICIDALFCIDVMMKADAVKMCKHLMN